MAIIFIKNGSRYHIKSYLRYNYKLSAKATTTLCNQPHVLLQLRVVLMTKFLGRTVRLRTKSYVNDLFRAAAVLIQATNCLLWYQSAVSEHVTDVEVSSFVHVDGCVRTYEINVRMDKHKVCSRKL